ncbi:MAG: hypothetical protein E7560_02980 [Ruminococcaceae bacterium]|nr:hypothetical protein [Oscillospiraceae bacterium]
MAEKIFVSKDFGIVANTGKDVSEQFQAFFDQATENAIFYISAGEYILKSKIELDGLKNVTISGFGAKLIGHFNPNPRFSAGAFEVTNCEKCTFKGFTYTNDNNTSSVGRICGIDRQANTVDVRLLEGYRMTGNEPIHAIDSCNEDYAPNWHASFNTPNPYPYTMIGDNVVRIFMYPTNACYLETISIDELMYIKHVFYDRPPFNFTACSDITIEDLTFLSTAGIIFGVYPRSHNFTFRRIRATVKNGTKALCAIPFDGIHIKGMTGKLIVEDCDFAFVGDDILNIHNKSAVVTTVEENAVNIGTVSEDWAREGDIVYIYDINSVEKKGQFKVKDCTTERITFTDLEGELGEGDCLANSAFYASVEIRRCRVNGSRARGFLLRTENILVEDCYFHGTSFAAILITLDAVQWSEMGPAKNVVIRNNIFEGCGTAAGDRRAAGVRIDCRDDHNTHGHGIYKAGVHKNITIEGNTFVNLNATAISALAVDGLKIKDNKFINCDKHKENCEEYQSYFISLDACDNVEIEGNQIVGGSEDMLVYEE